MEVIMIQSDPNSTVVLTSFPFRISGSWSRSIHPVSRISKYEAAGSDRTLKILAP
jgi:hypothetical protein